MVDVLATMLVSWALAERRVVCLLGGPQVGPRSISTDVSHTNICVYCVGCPVSVTPLFGLVPVITQSRQRGPDTGVRNLVPGGRIGYEQFHQAHGNVTCAAWWHCTTNHSGQAHFALCKLRDNSVHGRCIGRCMSCTYVTMPAVRGYLSGKPTCVQPPY